MGKHDPDDPVTMYIREASNVEPLTETKRRTYFDDWPVWAIGAKRGKMSRGDWLKVS